MLFTSYNSVSDGNPRATLTIFLDFILTKYFHKRNVNEC